jgi:nitrite reductase (NO-forming)
MGVGRTLLDRRAADRRVTAAALVIAASFVGLAVVTAAAPAAARMGWWLPLHLLLAGAAATAVGGVMPFFSAGVASVPPAPTAIRVLGVAGIAVGAVLVVTVRIAGNGVIDNGWLGAVAGGTYLAGMAAVAAATLLPLRAALGPRRAILAVSYGAALTSAALGSLMGTLAIAGWAPALAAWDVLRPAHAWLNVFGFLSLVIAASLLHLLPTVAGTRIERTPVAMAVLAGLMIGPLLVAAGFVLRLTPVALLGAALVVAGSLALVGHAATVVRRRGRWTTDLGWHRFVQGSLFAAVAWFACAAALAAASVANGGASSRGWDTALVMAPVALGWAAQALVGSWSHLVPAIGPGSPEVHARQRVTLGHWATARVLLAQVGVALAAIGIPAHQDGLALAGGAMLVVWAVTALGLLAGAIRAMLGVAPLAHRRISLPDAP